MANEAAPVSQREARLGGLSFFFLAVAVVGPYLNSLAVAIVHAARPLAGADPVVLAISLRIVFLLLALLLGIFSRRSRAGRLGFYGSAVLLAVGLIVVLFLVSRPAVPAVSPPPSLPPPR
jgi:hypothetical protein